MSTRKPLPITPPWRGTIPISLSQRRRLVNGPTVKLGTLPRGALYRWPREKHVWRNCDGGYVFCAHPFVPIGGTHDMPGCSVIQMVMPDRTTPVERLRKRP